MLRRAKMRRGLRQERATATHGLSAGVDIHEYKVRRAPLISPRLSSGDKIGGGAGELYSLVCP